MPLALKGELVHWAMEDGSMNLPLLKHPGYTLEDWKVWEGRWELINGVAFDMTPAPNLEHQTISSKLHISLGTALEDAKRKSGGDCLVLAAPLHDVGKVAISDLILKKPARFTPEEYRVMQAHTCFGARLFVDPQSELDVISAEVALRHHENWDGTGYPGMVDIWAEDPASAPLECDSEGGTRKLKGEEIPLGGRIVAVADVYDALISKRVYKEPWDSGKVLDEIRAMSGTKFDPEIVKAFFEILPRIEEIRSRYPDTEAAEMAAHPPASARAC